MRDWSVEARWRAWGPVHGELDGAFVPTSRTGELNDVVGQTRLLVELDDVLVPTCPFGELERASWIARLILWSVSFESFALRTFVESVSRKLSYRNATFIRWFRENRFWPQQSLKESSLRLSPSRPLYTPPRLVWVFLFCPWVEFIFSQKYSIFPIFMIIPWNLTFISELDIYLQTWQISFLANIR